MRDLIKSLLKIEIHNINWVTLIHVVRDKLKNCSSAMGPGLGERLSTTFMKFRLTQHVTLLTRGDRFVVSDDTIPVRNVILSDTE